MQTFNIDDLAQWERQKRANLLSSLTGYKPAMLVGTLHENGIANLSLFQNIVHLGANPALIGLISRPPSASPHTLSNIERTGNFSLNSVHASFIEKAHQTAAKYDAHTSEFEAVGLTPFFRHPYTVPFVQQSRIQLVASLVEVMPIAYNNTFLIIGSVTAFFVDEQLLRTDGFINLPQAEVACTVGLDGYAVPASIKRYCYPKPFEIPKSLIQ